MTHNILTEQMLSLNDQSEGCVAQWLATGARKPEVPGHSWATILARCRGELSTTITQLISKWL